METFKIHKEIIPFLDFLAKNSLQFTYSIFFIGDKLSPYISFIYAYNIALDYFLTISESEGCLPRNKFRKCVLRPNKNLLYEMFKKGIRITVDVKTNGKYIEAGTSEEYNKFQIEYYG